MKAKRINKKVRYTGETDLSLENGGVYLCIGEITEEGPRKGFLLIIDESKEDYLYAPDFFEFID